MKKVLTFMGIAIILISLALSYNITKKKNVELYGKIVTVEVIDIPVSCDMSNKNLKAFFKFRYKNKIDTKYLEDGYCEIVKTNKLIQLKTNSDNTIFIYPNENINLDIILDILLFVFGCVILYKSRKYE